MQLTVIVRERELDFLHGNANVWHGNLQEENVRLILSQQERRRNGHDHSYVLCCVLRVPGY
jgi:hypothetical protein